MVTTGGTTGRARKGQHTYRKGTAKGKRRDNSVQLPTIDFDENVTQKTTPKPILGNKLGITDQIKFMKSEEKITKRKAKELYDSGEIDRIEVGTFAGLKQIHQKLFSEIYDFAGKLRNENISNNNFRFAPTIYLESALSHIDEMPENTYDEIIEKYVEMNVAHPFREGNGRSTRMWLDLLLKNRIKSVVDWNLIDKEDYLEAMKASVVDDLRIKELIQNALTSEINSREIFMKGIDVSYYYEGYSEYSIDEL